MALTILGKREVFKGRFMSVWETKFLDKLGKERYWEWATKKDAVFIFPITQDNKIVLIKNYRIPLERYVIEIPAGLKDKSSEADQETAHRELLEETGYQTATLTPVPSWPYRSGATNSLAHGFIATGLTKVSDQHGDETEDITVLEIPHTELMNLYLHPAPDTLINAEVISLYHIALTMGLFAQSNS